VIEHFVNIYGAVSFFLWSFVYIFFFCRSPVTVILQVIKAGWGYRVVFMKSGSEVGFDCCRTSINCVWLLQN